MFSAVSSAFVIDIYSKLQPDPSDQTAALLRVILLTLNHSAIPNETPTVPTIPQNPPSEIVTATSLLFASLLLSLLAAFIAMLGKQWLNRHLRHAGGSMVERCGDRQIKCDGLQIVHFKHRDRPCCEGCGRRLDPAWPPLSSSFPTHYVYLEGPFRGASSW